MIRWLPDSDLFFFFFDKDFLPQYKHTKIRSVGSSKLPIGVNLAVNVCFVSVLALQWYSALWPKSKLGLASASQSLEKDWLTESHCYGQHYPRIL